jgi:hypothetical protein
MPRVFAGDVFREKRVVRGAIHMGIRAFPRRARFGKWRR